MSKTPETRGLRGHALRFPGDIQGIASVHELDDLRGHALGGSTQAVKHKHVQTHYPGHPPENEAHVHGDRVRQNQSISKEWG